ncbi:hypothetical protein [Caudoviricetes sp.]|nr:hypothetical protein [Caudoviricetes sp.]
MAVTDKDVAAWFAANPGATDAQIAQAAAAAGVSASQLSRVTGVPVSEVVSRVGATDTGTLSKAVTADTIQSVADQILAQGTTGQWTGEGAGSAEKNALWMADTLSKAGITDASQFGSWTDAEGNTVYGNKETGQVLPNTYGERQTGNAFGGTYAGEGNTAYRVQFDASGNPIFYTTGASSSDVGDLTPLLAIGSMLVAPGLSGLIGGATGLTGGALAAATGATLGAGTSALTGNDILKGALLGGGTGYLSSLLSSGVTDTDLLQQAADADMAAGMLPEYGTNAAYDQVMADLMANSPGATEQLQNIVDSQVGGTLGPDNIDIGGGWNPADTTDFSMEVTADRLPADTTYYSNEGLNYPGTGTTQGISGSPVNAATSTTTPSLNDVLNVVKAGTVVAGLTGAANAATGQTGFDIVPVPSDWKTPTYGQTGQWPALAPIDFGSRELLRGTQWEKYLNPAQPVTPVQAPAGISYNQLMNTLQGGQGGNLTLSDIISGIQSQYGQTTPSAVG